MDLPDNSFFLTDVMCNDTAEGGIGDRGIFI